jgi:hypothetical protein
MIIPFVRRLSVARKAPTVFAASNITLRATAAAPARWIQASCIFSAKKPTSAADGVAKGEEHEMPANAEDAGEIYNEMDEATHLGDIPKTHVSMSLSDIPHPHFHTAAKGDAGVKPKEGKAADGKAAQPGSTTASTTAEATESPIARAREVVSGYVSHAEVALMKAMYMEDLSRFRRYLVAAILSVTGATFIFWPQIKSYFVSETSDVASQLLSAKDVQEKASIFAKAVLNETLNDPVIFHEANRFIKQLLTAPETRELTMALISSTLQDPATKAELQRTTNDLLSWLMKDPGIREQLVALAVWLLIQPDTQRNLIDLTNRSFADPSFQEYGGRYVTDIFKQAFRDEPLKSAATKWLLDILSSDDLRRQGGDYLYAAYKNSITPSFLRSSGSGSPSSKRGADRPEAAHMEGSGTPRPAVVIVEPEHVPVAPAVVAVPAEGPVEPVDAPHGKPSAVADPGTVDAAAATEVESEVEDEPHPSVDRYADIMHAHALDIPPEPKERRHLRLHLPKLHRKSKEPETLDVTPPPSIRVAPPLSMSTEEHHAPHVLPSTIAHEKVKSIVWPGDAVRGDPLGSPPQQPPAP